MPPLNLVMMGTGDFAVPTFLALFDTPHRVVGLYTQPERTGPGHHRQSVNRMVQVARERNTPLFQPVNINTPESLEELRGLAADVFVVAAYGQILSAELLTIPRLAAINVHASLLPKYRGASPVAAAILNGETETGVSIIHIVPQLDAGPVLGVVRTPIGVRETTGELEERLAQLGAPLTASVLDQLAAGTASAIPQDPQLVTRARKLNKAMGAIDWTRPAIEIDRHVRGMQPWPNPFTFIHSGTRSPVRVLVLAVCASDAPSDAAPGSVVRADQSRLVIQTGQGAMEIERLQPDGKRAMAAGDFLRGFPLRAGDWLGEEERAEDRR